MKLIQNSVNTQLSVECPKNEEGYLYTKCSMMYKVVEGYLWFTLCVMILGLLFFRFLQGPTIKDKIIVDIISISYIILFLFVRNNIKNTANNEYVLEKKGMVIKNSKSKQFISYEKLKEAVQKWPMLQYKGRIIIIIDKEIIDIYYLKLLGGVGFIVNLAKRIDVDYITKEALLHKNRYGIAIASKNDKEEYKRRKMFIKGC